MATITTNNNAESRNRHLQRRLANGPSSKRKRRRAAQKQNKLCQHDLSPSGTSSIDTQSGATASVNKDIVLDTSTHASQTAPSTTAQQYACTRLVNRPVPKRWTLDPPSPHDNNVLRITTTSQSTTAHIPTHETKAVHKLPLRSPRGKLLHLQTFLSQEGSDDDDSASSGGDDDDESDAQSQHQAGLSKSGLPTTLTGDGDQPPRDPSVHDGTSTTTDEIAATPSLDDEVGNSPDTQYMQSPRYGLETNTPNVHDQSQDLTSSLLDCDDIYGAIDDVSNEVFHLIGPDVNLAKVGRSPEQHPNTLTPIPQAGKHIREASLTECDIVNHETSNPSQHLDKISADSPTAVPPPAKKRKMTGITSKHFSPVKPSRSPAKHLAIEPEPTSEPLDQVPATTCFSPLKDAQAVPHTPVKSSPSKRKTTGTKSPHFLPLHLLDRVDLPQPGRGRLPAGVSIAPVPSIRGEHFGIIQEKLWREPFWLIIAVIMLNKTKGCTAVPTFWSLRDRWPTMLALSEADPQEVCAMIQHCGLQTQRSKNMTACARVWLTSPPRKGQRHRTLHYPKRGDGLQFKPNAIVDVDTDDCAGAVEIGHLPGCGAYAYDSWRIFCRDVCRGIAEDYNGKGAVQIDFEPEWKRVVPQDKELRATLRWMWLREGRIWDCETGETRAATADEMERAVQGEMHVADADELQFAARAAGVELGSSSRQKIQTKDKTASHDLQKGETLNSTNKADLATRRSGSGRLIICHA